MAKNIILLLIFLTACSTQQTLPAQNNTNNIVAEQEISPEPILAPIEKVPDIQISTPDEVYFWVNNMLIPETTLYNGSQFLSIRKDQIRTFAGLFGPYFDDPTNEITVVLCAELTKIQAPLSCERMEIVFRDRYVSFANGFGPDEYIGGRVYKDYTAYYNVYQGNTTIAASRKAVIRTVG